jgi:hypothetical protein
MKFAVNYSPTLGRLVQEGRVRVDCYKCPDWPKLLEELQGGLPIYVHFALGIGNWNGRPADFETKQPADLDHIAEVLEMTGTPYVNTHFGPKQSTYPDIPIESTAPAHIQRVIDGALRDLEPLIKRFGAERVTVENIINEYGNLTVGMLPETFHRLLEQTGCGFLFDLSHARITAENMGLDPRAYSASMPVQRIREVHITGLQVVEGWLLERMIEIGDPYGFAKYMKGRRVDHLPMTEADWPDTAWMMDQFHTGTWQKPWVVAYECGGIGPFWDDVSEESMYLEHLPKLDELISMDNH